MSNNTFQQSNIILCGSPRVGKSTLINAIFQQQLTKSHASLNSFTKKMTRYSYEYSNGQTTHETIIWDTPGIESWHEDQVRRYMKKLIQQTQPLCMIYCASPGSFVGLDHLTWLVSECHQQHIFCALVCTNMWSGRNRQEVVKEFCQVLNSVHPNVTPTIEDNITYYDRLALVTRVNSEEYVDRDIDIRKPPSGVEELIFGIAKCLDQESMFAWFGSVAHNTSFWSTMSSKLSDLLKIPVDTFISLSRQVLNVLNFFSTSSNSTTIDDPSSIITTDTEQNSSFMLTFESEDPTMISELNQTLSDLGAKHCKTKHLTRGNKQLLAVIAEFDNTEHNKAISKLWQLANSRTINCSLGTE